MGIKAVDVNRPATIRSPQNHTRHHVGEHDINAHASLSKASLGKPPKPKGYHVGIHNGATEQQHNVAGLGGLSHATSTAIANSAQLEIKPARQTRSWKIVQRAGSVFWPTLPRR